MTLHTFNKPDALNTARAFIKEGDQLVFLENGVYCLTRQDLSLPTNEILALRADLLARGLTDRVGKSVQQIGYDEFVAACVDARSISNWF